MKPIFTLKPVMRGGRKTYPKPKGFKKTGEMVIHKGKKRAVYSHPQHGSGFFDNVGNWFKKAGNWINDKIIQPIAKSGAISSGLAMIPKYGGPLSTAAKSLGMGKQRGMGKAVIFM